MRNDEHVGAQVEISFSVIKKIQELHSILALNAKEFGMGVSIAGL